ncbi:MAG: sarcosine oxidase subunit gamma family protein [Gaiellaceae bacterium]
MSFEFLAPDAAVADDRFAPIARSPMERAARAAGARFEARDGWNVAVGYASLEQEREACRRAAGWADVSHLGKLELHATAADDLTAVVAQVAGGATLELGTATRAADAWWLPLTAERAVVVCEPGAVAGSRERLEEAAGAASRTFSIVDATCKYGAMTLVGPLAREVFARFTAVDLRPKSTPVGAFRPVSIARTPGMLVREGEDRFLFLFGAALGAYMWETVADAGTHLGAAPVGVEALEEIAIAVEEAGRA